MIISIESEGMMGMDDELRGNVKYYRHISLLTLVALTVAGAMLLWLNTISGCNLAQAYLGSKAAFGLQLFFWGALGGAIASSLYLAWDKEENELERVKAAPDPTRLRYPNEIDVHLYCHRIVTSACLAVVGGMFLYAGLSYFDVPAALLNQKHRAFFIIFSFLIGLYQGKFLTFLNKRFQKILDKSDTEASTEHTKGKAASH